MILASLLALALAPPGLVIRGGTVYDGLGGPGRIADIRIEGDTIRQVGVISVNPGDTVIPADGMAVSPGFIDSHSHADGGIFLEPNAETHIRQGITTSVVGEDGGSSYPLRRWFDRLRKSPAALNFGSFVGHGTVRALVMGQAARKSTPDERKKMVGIVDQEMRSGALGLSSGLEYEPGRYGDTAEVAELASVAAKRRGMYISHVRNEDIHAFEAFNELIEIARRAHLPAEINHIKLGSARVWGRASDVVKMMLDASKEGLKITADVYPYRYWQSTIRVLIPTEDWDDRAQWKQGLADIGGPMHVLLTHYSPDKSWAGKTIAQISEETGKDPVTVVQEIVTKCYRNGNHGSEGVVVTAMTEEDVRTFIACPLISFCSDGGLHGSHPRCAGSFPRVLGVYVREQGVISLAEAIRKMTSLPASRFGFKDRGTIAPGMKADLVIFDPATVKDTATIKDPEAKPLGIPTVIVNGVPVLRDGVVTGAHPGRALFRQR